MKKVKIFIALLMCVALVLSCTNIVASLDFIQEGSEVVFMDEKILSNASIEQNFADDRVLVVLDKNISAINQVHGKSLFDITGIESVSDLTAFKNYETHDKQSVQSIGGMNDGNTTFAHDTLINEEEFRQIILLELSQKSKSNVLKTIKELEQLDGIVYAGPDYITKSAMIPSDSEYSELWGLEKIQATQAWDITTGSQNIKIGVIDSGIANHVDLNANVTQGKDFVNNTNSTITTDDLSGHGTHVAGTIGAIGNNGTGVSGVSWNVTLVPLQVTREDGDSSSISDEIEAITYAIENNIPILNYSRAGKQSFYSAAFKQAVANYQGLFICAAGNNSIDTDITTWHAASYNLPNMISVANSKPDELLNSGSNYGATTVHLAAPGTSIYSCVPGDRYEHWTGTSMAAPHVTGVAALIMSLRPDLSPTEVKALILNNVDHVEALEGKCITEGRLNAYKAVLAATQDPTLMGDVNGDGRSDMILSRNISGKRALTVFLGKSNGGFTEPVTTNSIRAYIYYDPVFTGDFNGDGLCDVLIHWRDYNTHKRRFLVYTSRGDGTFNDATQLSCALSHEPLQYPCTFHVDDVNGDGKDDFIIVMKNGSGNYSALVYKGTSASPYLIDTSAYAVSSTKVYNSSNQVFTGDFNGDGRADILVHRSSSTYIGDSGKNQTIVYLGNADGTFNEGSMLTSVRNYDLATHFCKFFVADVQGNGRDDYIVHYKDDAGKRSTLVYSGATYPAYLVDTTTDALNSINNYIETDPVFVGDVNGDGRADMIVHWSNGGKRQLLVYLANANGTYNTGINTATINSCDPAQYDDMYFVDDVNGDGREDFIVKYKRYDGVVCLLTYLGTANGTFSAAIRTEPTTAIPYYS